MVAKHSYKSFKILILQIGLFLLTDPFCEGQSLSVTAYLGYGGNVTYHVIDDKVTWFTANEACVKEISGSKFSLCGKHCVQRLIAQLGTMVLTDDFIWIGLLKEHDNVVYTAEACDVNNRITDIIVGGQSNRKECVGVNTTSGHVHYDKCANIHPYICKEYTAELGLMEYPNITVDLGENIKWGSEVFLNQGEDTCKLKCENYFACIAALYDSDNDTCERLVDSSGDFLPNYTLTISSDNYLNNKLYVKHGPRTYLKKYTPIRSRQHDPYTELNCITTREECPCDCNNGSTFVIHTTETLAEWKKNITNTLKVDKKKLSSHTRKLLSAKDSRVSSKVYGYFGAAVISLVVFFLTFHDVITFILFCKRLIWGHWKHNS